MCFDAVFLNEICSSRRRSKNTGDGKVHRQDEREVQCSNVKRNKKSPTKKSKGKGDKSFGWESRGFPSKAKEKGDKSKKNSPLAEYQEIVDKNLFRPLGWEDKKPNNPFKLAGTVIDSSSQKAKAIITRAGNPEIFFVSEGDIISNGYKVEEVSANKVKLANAENGESFVMQVGWTPLVGQSSKGKGGKSQSTRNSPKNRKPSANRGKGRSRDGRKSTGKRELSKRAIEAWTALKQSRAWRNASPAQRKQMGEDLKSGLGDKYESSDSDDDK